MPATVSRLVEHFVRVIEGSETFLSQLLEGVMRKALRERQIAWDKNVSQATAELSLLSGLHLCAHRKESEIPPTAVGGSFKSFLQPSPKTTIQSRQRKLADRSSPSYLS